MKKHRKTILFTAAGLAVVLIVLFSFRRRSLVSTGLVTTDEVIVASEVQGRLEKLNVQPGDTVKAGQVLAVVAPAEARADLSYFESLAQSATAQVAQAEAELNFQETLTTGQIKQAEANLAAARSQAAQAESELEIARLNFERAKNLRQQGANSAQDYDLARTSYDGAQARANASRQQVGSSEAALALAQAGAAQVAARRAAVNASKQQLDAARAQREKSDVRFGYTQVKAPCDGIVNLRAALPGEVVNPGQAIVTLINPDDLWVRADVEESYIDRIHLGDRFTVRLPSGATRVGTVYFRGIDADYATQRDVSRTKRDIKTFEIRLRCDNRDRSLAVGMTASVVFAFSR